jgi:hypothetical protein
VGLHTDHERQTHARYSFSFFGVKTICLVYSDLFELAMQDIVEAKEFLAKKGVDVGSE